MRKNWLDRMISASLLILNITFLVYWCILAFYSRPHYDDLHFMWRMQEMSLLDFVKFYYCSRSGRFVAYGINGFVSMVNNCLGFHQFWAILYYAVGIGICWLVVKDQLRQVPRKGLFLGVWFIYNLYVLTNIDFPVFTWLCAMGYYIGLPMLLLILKYMNMERLDWKQWSLLSLMVVYVGGSGETFTPIVLLAMFFYGMYVWHSKHWSIKETWASPQIKRVVWTAVVLLVLLVIVVFAPGNFVRLENGFGDEGFSHPVGIVGWLKATAEAIGMFFYFMTFYIPYYLVAFVLAYYVGGKSQMQLPTTKLMLILVMVSVFIAFLLLSALPNIYLYNGFGIQRTYTSSVLLLLLVFVGTGYVMGIGGASLPSGWISLFGILVLTVIMGVNIVNDTPMAKSYGKAVDERMETLLKLRDMGQEETVTVSPLPVPYTEDVKHRLLTALGKDTPMSVLYYISDTDTVPNEYESHVKHLLKLDFDFVLPKKGDVVSQK